MPKNPIFEAATRRQTHIIYIASLLGDYEAQILPASAKLGNKFEEFSDRG